MTLFFGAELIISSHFACTLFAFALCSFIHFYLSSATAAPPSAPHHHQPTNSTFTVERMNERLRTIFLCCWLVVFCFCFGFCFFSFFLPQSRVTNNITANCIIWILRPTTTTTSEWSWRTLLCCVWELEKRKLVPKLQGKAGRQADSLLFGGCLLFSGTIRCCWRCSSKESIWFQ